MTRFFSISPCLKIYCCYDITHFEKFKGCVEDARTDPCAIEIRTRLLGTTSTYDEYDAWRVGDDHLDWYGPEIAQGSYASVPASGTPLHWTSNDPFNPNYQELNE